MQYAGSRVKEWVQGQLAPLRTLPISAFPPTETTTEHPVCGALVSLQREKARRGKATAVPSRPTVWRKNGNHLAAEGLQTSVPLTGCCTPPLWDEKGSHLCGLPLKAWPYVGQALDGAPRASQSPEQAQRSALHAAGPGRERHPGAAAPVSAPTLLPWLESSTVATWEADIGGHGARGAGALGPTSVPSGELKIAPE